jgi:hypothetical protein
MFNKDNILKDDGLAYRLHFNHPEEKHHTSDHKNHIPQKLSLDSLIYMVKCMHKHDDCVDTSLLIKNEF